MEIGTKVTILRSDYIKSKQVRRGDIGVVEKVFLNAPYPYAVRITRTKALLLFEPHELREIVWFVS